MLNITSSKYKFVLTLNNTVIGEFHVLEPKFQPLQIIENIKRGREIERQLIAGVYPQPFIQAKFNALTHKN